jgi:ABC-2 type transport system ATP-binding protein
VHARDHHRQGKVLADASPAELEARSRYHQAVSLTTAECRRRQGSMSRVADVAAVEIDPQDHRLTAFPKPGKQIFGAISDC